MLTLYGIFVWQAAKLVALGTAAVVVAFAVLHAFGVDAAMLALPALVAPFGLVLIQTHVGKNLGWILGLPVKKSAIAWLNFAINVSIAVFVACGCAVATLVGYAVVMQSMPSLGHGRASQAPSQLSPLSVYLALGGITLLASLFWSVSGNEPAGSSAARRAKLFAMLCGVAAVVLLVVALSASWPLIALSPLLLVPCVGAAHASARALGAGRAQVRRWMAIGASIGLAEILFVFGLGVAGARSSDSAVVDDSAKLIGDGLVGKLRSEPLPAGPECVAPE